MNPDAQSPAVNVKRKPKNPTWEHPKGSGIKIAEMPNKTGGKVFGVSYQIRVPAELLGQPGKREMHQRKTRADAERLAEDRFLALKAHGTQFSQIPASAQKEAAIAWSKLDEHNRAKEAEARSKNGGKLPDGFAKYLLNFIEVVEAGIQTLSPAGGLRTFSEVCEELRTSKAERLAKGELGADAERDFRNRSKTLEAAFGAKLVSVLTAEDIAKALKSYRAKLSQRSVLNYRNTLAEILTHATAKQYTHRNPLENFTREDYKKLGGEKAERDLDGINILSVEEARRLLAAAEEHATAGMLATVVLRLFCGIRTAEVCRLDWKDVHWTDAKPYVHIAASIAKKRRVRHVDIPLNALAWLTLCNPPAEGRLEPHSHKGYTKRFARIVKLAGIGKLDTDGEWRTAWENNDTRHSFGSYHYALCGNALLTAGQMGHKQNDDVLFSHYRSLVRKDQAEEYFGLVPSTGAEKVTAFPQAASA